MGGGLIMGSMYVLDVRHCNEIEAEKVQDGLHRKVNNTF